LGGAADNNVDKINDIYDYSQKFGYNFYALTSSLPIEIKEWIENTGAEYPFCTMDDIALKTMIRSNPGLLLLKNGTVINKWPNKALPHLAESDTPLDNSDIGAIPKNHDARNMMIISLILIIPLLILFLFDFFYYRKRRKHRHKRSTH
jgi:triosephosphate isomerase